MPDPLVLIGEDDADHREVLREILGSEGFTVIEAASPKEVAGQLARHPAVLVLDINGAYGPEVAAALAAMGAQQPELLVASGDARVREFARSVGAAEALPKPFDLDSLVAAVRRAAERHRHRAELAGRDEAPMDLGG